MEQLLRALSDFSLVALLWLLGPFVGYGVAKDHGLSRPLGVIAGVLLGPILALFLYAVKPTHRNCPQCDEAISVKARVCPHCQRDLPQPAQPRPIATSTAARRHR